VNVIEGAIGMVLAAVLVRGLRALVFGVEVYDPLTFAVAAAVLGCAAIAGAHGPARRAASVDPLLVLKAE